MKDADRINLIHALDDCERERATLQRRSRVASGHLTDALAALRAGKPHIAADLIARARAQLSG